MILPLHQRSRCKVLKFKEEHENLKQQLENNNQTLSGNSNIQISAGKDVNITISEGDKFSDSVNMEERK